MKEWKTYKLGDLINIQSGGTPNKAISAYWGGGIPWISAKTMYVDFITDSDLHITEEGLKNGSKLAPIGSILLLTRGSGLFNRIPVCLVKEPVAYNQDIKCITVKDGSITSNAFMFFWLYSQKELLSGILETTGIGAGKIDTCRLLDINVLLPDIETQSKFIQFCSSILEKIEVNKQINDNLEQQAQALYKSWFVDFEPFKDGEFIESELGQIPEGWQCIPFSMFVSESKAKTGKIGIKEYSVTNNGIFPRDAKYNKSLSQSSTKNKLILYGDLVFGMSRDILNWGVMQEEQGGVSSAYTVYNINSGIVNSTYLELFIKSRIHLFSDLIRPAAREGQGIDKSVLQTKVLLCPPQEVLDTFWPLYNSVTNQIQRTTTEINFLGDVRDTLLPKLMSGELKINEIDC